jgi:hypothetical protein
MDISRLIIHPIGLKNYACDPSDGRSSVCYYTCCSRSGSISNCTTRRGTSLGEEIAGCSPSSALVDQAGTALQDSVKDRIVRSLGRDSDPRPLLDWSIAKAVSYIGKFKAWHQSLALAVFLLDRSSLSFFGMTLPGKKSLKRNLFCISLGWWQSLRKQPLRE